MRASRLAPMDSSFLAVESPTAHMHVGWISTFSPPRLGRRPGFEELREHIAERLDRAPRYRQRLAEVPLGLANPAWIDDPDFDIERHVVRADSPRLAELAAKSMSEPLPHERPLWQITIAERLDDDSIGVIGKAHHCMVDGIAAVELAGLLMDPEPDPEPIASRRWRPQMGPRGFRLLGESLISGAGARGRFAARSLATLFSPGRVAQIPHRLRAVGRAATDSARPALPSSLNEPLSAERHAGFASRPLNDLRQIGRVNGATLNDVLLGATAGALRSHQISRGEAPSPLKAMVPVNVRSDGEEAGPGNRISFMFIDLPCDEPDARRRLRLVHAATTERKHDEVPAGSEALLELAAQAPRPVRRQISRMVASPRTFNLVVSNIPGPAQPLYMRGCRLERAYPIVPLAEGHSLSVGMTSIRDRVCFGLYADRHSLPEVRSGRRRPRGLDRRPRGHRAGGRVLRGSWLCLARVVPNQAPATGAGPCCSLGPRASSAKRSCAAT